MSTLAVRKLKVDLSKGFGRHWLGGDAYRTQLFNTLSMTFPMGEQAFIDSVRAVPEERMTDPALRAEVKDFIGQEASHRFVHERFNAHLARQGLVFSREQKIARRFRYLAKMNVLDRLAVTCALEHYTAMLADGVLRHPEWLADAEPDLRTLWTWHAVEESEHKAVAFDVYRAAGGGYWRRVLWNIEVNFMFMLDINMQTIDNLRRDGELFKLGTWCSAARTWFGRRGIAWHLLGPALGYFRPSFHPLQHDNRDLTANWLKQNGDAYRVIGQPPAS